MTELLAQTFYGNSIQTWLSAFAIILLSALLGRTVYWVFSKVITIGLNNAGYDAGALISGLALAMAAKDTVFGGFTIFTNQPFKLSNRIKVAGLEFAFPTQTTHTIAQS